EWHCLRQDGCAFGRHPQCAAASPPWTRGRRTSSISRQPANRNAAGRLERGQTGRGSAARRSIQSLDAVVAGLGVAADGESGRPTPVAFHRSEHRSRILAAPEAAVIAAERTVKIALLDVEVVAKNSAAVAEIGAQRKQIMAAV